MLIAAAACEMHPTAVVKGVGAGEHRKRALDGGGRAGPRGRRRPRCPRSGSTDDVLRRRSGDPGLMRANRAYELIVHRQGRFFRPSDALEQVEVIEIDTGEVLLFWDTRPRDTGKLARALRADLAQLDADEFLAKWRRYQAD